MASDWVKREYQAFYNHCFRSGSRRLIPVLVSGYQASQLPLFLRQLRRVRPALGAPRGIDGCTIRSAFRTQHDLDAAERSSGYGDTVRLNETLLSQPRKRGELIVQVIRLER